MAIPTEAEQIHSIEEAERAIFAPFAFSVSQEDIDHILRTGSNTSNHRMILVAEFSKQKTLEDMTETLRRVYHGGNGIATEHGRITAWYTEDGIHLAAGETARYTRIAQVLSWTDAAKRIGELLERGRFATNIEVVAALGYERRRMAEGIVNLYWDTDASAREQGYMPTLAGMFGGSHSDCVEAATNALADPVLLPAILAEYKEFRAACKENSSLMRFRYRFIDELDALVDEYTMPRRDFDSTMPEIPKVLPFITNDELAKALSHGSSFSSGKARIYDYFIQPHTPKEYADFLKKEYGIGGRSHALSSATHSSEDHDGKGLHYKKLDCPEIHLSWSQVVKQIQELIRLDRYLTPAEKADLEAIREMHDEPVEIPDDRILEATDLGEINVEYARARLEAAGIVNGEVVDPEKLANAPIVRAVEAIAAELEQESAEPAALSDAEFAQQHLTPGETVFEIDGRTFMVDRVNLESGSVNFQDITFANATGFPIFRVEPISYVRRIMEEADAANPLLDPTKYQLMEIMDQEALFSNGRFDRSVLPPAMFCYDIRGDSYGYPAHLEPSVTVDHFGSILTKKPIHFPEEGYIDLTENDDWTFVDSEITIAEYIRRAEPRAYTSEVMAVYPAEQNGLPYDIVTQKLRFDQPQQEQPAPAPEPQNFRITDDELGHGGPKTKYGYNVDAIRTLKQIEAEGRAATPEEQAILSKYVGWGGIPQAFDERNGSWANEYVELKKLLTLEEYDAAMGSVLNAHYTSPTVIRAIYDAVERMGFTSGNILEPAMGVGNFFGMMPDSMRDSRLYGVELDSISGRIAQQLYPKANITVAGFETTDRRDFYDLAVGNVPFGNYKVDDRAYNKLGLDRLIQQCILQVLEPICEAKFFKRSNGFRPNHSAENAIAQAERMIQSVGCRYVIDIDIKSFFDNVNHGKLLKQMWTLGIRDKKLLSIISVMLKAEVAGIGFPEKGTPQGGIISPLLSNIVLNELDWWIVSQWEEMPTRRNYVHRIYANGTPDKSSTIRTLRNYTNLKECYVVRYADDFKIFCKKRSDAVKLFEATKQWLWDRLGLEISPEKSKIVNLKRHYSEFLGFKLKVRTKGKKSDGQPRYVVEAHIKDKALLKIREKSKEIIGQIRQTYDPGMEYRLIQKYNSYIIGVHNYYSIATHVNTDFHKIAFDAKKSLYNRLKHRLQKKGQITNRYIKEKYGTSREVRYLNGHAIAPIAYVQHKVPMDKKGQVNKYTPEGRAQIHKNLASINMAVLYYLMNHPCGTQSVEYNDNRIALYVAQKGKCAVSGVELEANQVDCHHKKPLAQGGNDSYQNLMIVSDVVHILIHSSNERTIRKYLKVLNLDKKQLAKLNKLRVMAEMPELVF